MIPEIDIWRAASLMLKRYGEKALEESAARADELAVRNDYNGEVVWRITDAIGQLVAAGTLVAVSPIISLANRRIVGAAAVRALTPAPARRAVVLLDDERADDLGRLVAVAEAVQRAVGFRIVPGCTFSAILPPISAFSTTGIGSG
jgi:hypothetical protein